MINRIFIAVLLLSIAGGIISSIFLITQKKIYKYTSANFVTIINIIVIFCFVLPFFKILSHIDNSSNLLYQWNLVVWVKQNTLKSYIYTFLKNINFAEKISFIWLIGTILFLLKEIVLYFYFIFYIRKRSNFITHSLWLKTFQQTYTKLSYNKDIQLLTSNIIKQPCTTGIRKPMILIPTYLLNALKYQEIEMILSHELVHIKKKDIFFKLFISLLNSLNWFNPLFYLLKNNLEEWIEIGCDEKLIISMNSEQRNLYINILMKLNEEEWKQQQKQAILYFNNKNLKKRIWGIMKKKNLGNSLSKMVIIVLTVASISTGSIIAKAADYSVNEIFSNHIDILDQNIYDIDEVALYDNEKFIDFDIKNLSNNKKNFVDFDVYSDTLYKFISKNGEQINFIENENSSTMHMHKYEKINIKEHKKNKDGSCIVKIYEGMRCSICKKVLKGDLISKTEFVKCKH